RPPEVKTQFHWRKEASFADAVELCNGAGVCRKLAESGGGMCPSYMATKEEKDSTRGRANLFRQLFSGRQQDAFESEELHEALDLCISCKACKSECPANVDMARMKAEFMQGWHERNGITLRERFFGQAGRLYPLASLLPSLSNWMLRQPAVKELLEQLIGIDKRRKLPDFASQTFMDWFKEHQSSPKGQNGHPTTRPDSKQKVVLFVDIFTNHHSPDIGKAAVRFLEAQGYEVIVPDIHDLGRPQLSKGMVAQAKRVLDSNLPRLTNYAERGLPIVGLEPSEILTLRDEYLDLCDDEQLSAAQKVAENSFLFEEFALQILTDNDSSLKETGQKVYIHGHCHAKSLVGNGPTEQALQRAGYETKILDTGCCGMAGSFGYEKEHYDISMDIGNLVLFPALRDLPEDALVCAPGFSCQHQINDGVHRQTYHPAQLLAQKF